VFHGRSKVLAGAKGTMPKRRREKVGRRILVIVLFACGLLMASSLSGAASSRGPPKAKDVRPYLGPRMEDLHDAGQGRVRL
ncbi:MAG: hypothetical protein WA761_01560, partial [Thermoplasmata archaeon]